MLAGGGRGGLLEIKAASEKGPVACKAAPQGPHPSRAPELLVRNPA